MQSSAGTLNDSVSMQRTGWILTIAVSLFLLIDVAIHLLKPAPVVIAFAELGYPIALASGIALLELVCIVLYLAPRTAILGAILLTGYLGGAVASNVRVEHPAFECIFPAIMAALAWGGLYLRDRRVRELIPLQN